MSRFSEKLYFVLSEKTYERIADTTNRWQGVTYVLYRGPPFFSVCCCCTLLHVLRSRLRSTFPLAFVSGWLSFLYLGVSRSCCIRLCDPTAAYSQSSSIFSIFFFFRNQNSVFHVHFRDCFENFKQTKWLKSIAYISVRRKNINLFPNRRYPCRRGCLNSLNCASDTVLPFETAAKRN